MMYPVPIHVFGNGDFMFKTVNIMRYTIIKGKIWKLTIVYLDRWWDFVSLRQSGVWWVDSIAPTILPCDAEIVYHSQWSSSTAVILKEKIHT